MWSLGIKLAALALPMAMMTSVPGMRHLKAPMRVLRMGRQHINLPFRSAAHVRGLAAIERAALQATGGGQIDSVRPSVWVGKPVWMCTVSQGRTVWHVMVNQTTLRPISKIVVPHH